MATVNNAPALAMACPDCGSLRTRKARRLRRQDWTRKLAGGEAWRCRDCRRRFYLRPDGEVIAGLRKSADRPSPAARLRAFHRLRRWWRNSWRWRSRRMRVWNRRIAVGLMLLTAVFLFLLFLMRAPAGGGES